MLSLALRTLRFRKGGFAAAFIALFFGSALVMGCGMLLETGIHSVATPNRLAGSSIVVAGDTDYRPPSSDPEHSNSTETLVERVPLDSSLVGDIARLPGVTAAVPEGLSGKVYVIAVSTAPGADVQAQVETLAGQRNALALTGDDRGRAEFPEVTRASEDLVALSAVFGGMAILISIFVVAGTFALSIHQRLREMALLRAIGTTSGQVRRLVIGEAVIVSVVATGLGVLPGIPLGEFLFERLQEYGVVPSVLELRFGWVPAVVAGGAGLLTAIVSGFGSARRASTARPVEVLTDSSLQRKWFGWFRLLCALLAFGGGLALFIVTMSFTGGNAASTAGPMMMLWAVFLALLGPGVAKVLILLLGPLLRVATGLSGYLAVSSARTRAIRLASAITPIMLATGMACTMLYIQSTQAESQRQGFLENLRADAVLTSPAGGFSPGDERAVLAVPGVLAATPVVTSSVFYDSPGSTGDIAHGVPAQGVTPEGLDRTMNIALAAGNIADLRGNTAILPEAQAKEIGVQVGDSVALRLGDRSQARVRVVGLSGNSEMILLPVRLLAPHTTLGLAPNMLVRLAPGVSPSVLSGLPGVMVADRDVVYAAQADRQRVGDWVNYLLAGVIVAYTALAVVNTLIMATAERRGEFALLRLTGATKGQVMRMMTVEGVLVAVCGLVLGTVITASTLVPFSIALTGSVWPTGSPVVFVVAAAGAFVLALSATLLPSWAALRHRPVEVVANLA